MNIYTIATFSIRNISLFLIISLVVVSFNYNNNPFSSFDIVPYHQTALGIPNLQANNTNISSSASNGTSTNIIPTANHPPVVKVGPDKIVNESATVMLFGVAIDPDPNDKVSYSWMQIAGPAITLNGADTDTPSFTAPSVSEDTIMTFALTVTDDKGATTTSTVKVTVKYTAPLPSGGLLEGSGVANATSTDNVQVTEKYIPPPNRRPIADAGEYSGDNFRYADAGDIVTLDGTSSSDPDGDPLKYTWTQTSGPPITLNGADTATPSFTAPTLSEYSTMLQFLLSVTDNKGNTSSEFERVTIFIKNPSLPLCGPPSPGRSEAAKAPTNCVPSNPSNRYLPLE